MVTSWAVVDAESARDQAERPLGKLLDQVVALVRRFVVLSPEQADAVALWIAHTHVFEAAELSPYLAVVSAEKRSGKTTLLKTLERLCRNPWRVVNPSEAVVYRKIDRDHPTVLLDEIDTVFGGAREYEGLRAILNAGNERGVLVPRCGGPNRDQLEEFEIYSPKAFAGIGIASLPETVRDRSIVVELTRRAADEPVEKFRRRRVREAAEPVRQALADWTDAGRELLVDAEPEVPELLSDRAADIWEPLLAIADLAGGCWPERARRAAVCLCTEAEAEDDSIGVRLLADIRTVFDSQGTDKLSSAELVDALVQLEDAPWPELRGKPLTQSALARLLKRYHIRPKSIRLGQSTPKGYERGQFTEAFRRYLPPAARNSRNMPATSGSEPAAQPATSTPVLRLVCGRSPGRQADVAAVAALTRNDREGRGRGAAVAPAPPAGLASGRGLAEASEAA